MSTPPGPWAFTGASRRLHIPELFESGQVLAWADEWCRRNDLINSGDRVVIVRGVIPNNPNHNALLVHEVE